MLSKSKYKSILFKVQKYTSDYKSMLSKYKSILSEYKSNFRNLRSEISGTGTFLMPRVPRTWFLLNPEPWCLEPRFLEPQNLSEPIETWARFPELVPRNPVSSQNRPSSPQNTPKSIYRPLSIPAVFDKKHRYNFIPNARDLYVFLCVSLPMISSTQRLPPIQRRT